MKCCASCSRFFSDVGQYESSKTLKQSTCEDCWNRFVLNPEVQSELVYYYITDSINPYNDRKFRIMFCLWQWIF